MTLSPKEFVFKDFVLPLIVSEHLPEQLMELTLVAKLWNKVLNNNIRWKKHYLFIFGSQFHFFDALESLNIICDIPNEIWRQEYIYRFLSVREKCSFCYHFGAFTEGNFYKNRGVCICEKCWKKVVWDEEKKEKMIHSCFTEENLEKLMDMDIVLGPSFVMHNENYYLKCDVENFISLGGGKELVKNNNMTWRKILKRELINAGLSEDKATDYSYKSFPSDGTVLQDLIDQILVENELKEKTLSQMREENIRVENLMKEKRKEELMTEILNANIDQSIINIYPYQSITTQFIEGHNSYKVEDIISLLKGASRFNDWELKFQSLLDVEKITYNPPTIQEDMEIEI